MSKNRAPQQPKTRSHIGRAAIERRGGIHRDQKRRIDHKRLRRDKSFREDY